jgi:cytochrome c
MFVGAARAGYRLVLGAAIAAILGSAAQADVTAGALVFKQNCAVCHSATPGEVLVGPSLSKLVGRKAGSAPGYPFSAAMKSAGYSWTAATLDPFIAAPRKVMPKTNMAFPGLQDPVKREDLIAYLTSLK